MKKLLRSLAAVAVALAASGALALGLAGSASATTNPPWEPVANPPEVGTLNFFDANGLQIIGGSLTAQPLAAYVQGTTTIRSGDTKATLFGYLPVLGQAPGAWSGEALSASTTFPNASAPGTLASSAIPLVTGASGDESISTLEGDFPNTDTSTTDGYGGAYVLRLKTSASGLSPTTSYDATDISVNGTAGTWSVTYPVPTTLSTTTTLTTTQSSPQVSGTSVTLNAVVSPPVPGTVQFEVGTTDIGSPVTVSAGTASTSTASLPTGPDTLNAVFTPAQFYDYTGSTGTTPFTITGAGPTATTTALAVNPPTAAADTTVALTATVSQTSNSNPLASGAGTVSFYDNGSSTSDLVSGSSTLLGSGPVGTGGTATLNYSSFATGAHNLLAEFTPANGVNDSGSTSVVVLFTATAPTVAPDAQPLTVAIPAGAITITTPYTATNPFQLGTAVLNPAGGSFSASAPFGNSNNPNDGVTITDTLAGDAPWTASATVTNFTDSTSDIINAQNLTFTGVTPSYVAGNALQSGDVVVNNVTNTAVYGPTATGSDGLAGGPHQFATAALGDGSVYIDGLLTLTAPSSTPAGTYTATITFTVT
ncbi:MAG: Ig-like domain repeat protein [Acidimicrobiales bacterium]|jgi:hypothetical protein